MTDEEKNLRAQPVAVLSLRPATLKLIVAAHAARHCVSVDQAQGRLTVGDVARLGNLDLVRIPGIGARRCTEICDALRRVRGDTRSQEERMVAAADAVSRLAGTPVRKPRRSR